MRFLLSSDWRLGRCIHGMSLLPEQAAFADQLVATARERRVDAVLLAGGLLDDAAPAEAAQLLEELVARLVLDESIPVVALHGGASEAPGRGVLSRVGLHLLGSGADGPVEIGSGEERLSVHALPESGDDLAARLTAAAAALRKDERALLIGRLPAGGDLSEAKSCRGFAAVCLGGRAEPAELVKGRAWSAGSPWPTSFEEAPIERGLTLLELDGRGKARRELVPLPQPPLLRRLSGSAAELAALAASDERVRLVVQDAALVPELADLVARWPRALELERSAPAAGTADTLGLFAAHHRRALAQELPQADRALLAELLPARAEEARPLVARAALHADALEPAALAAALAAAADPAPARELELALEDRLLEVEGRADALRLQRSEALATASAVLGEDPASPLTLEELDERREYAKLQHEDAEATVRQLDGAAVRARELLETATARERRLEELAAARDRLRSAEAREAEIHLLERELERAERAAGLARSEKKLTDRKSLKAQEKAGLVLRAAEERRAALQEERAEAALALARAEQRAESAAASRERLAELDDLEAVLALLERTRASLTESETTRRRQQERRDAAAEGLAALDERVAAAVQACARARAALGDEGAERLEQLRTALVEAGAQLDAVQRLADAQARRKQATKAHATTMIRLDRARRSREDELRQLQRRLSGDGTPPDEAEIEAQRQLLAGLEEEIAGLEREQAAREAEAEELGPAVLRLRQELGNLAYEDHDALQRRHAALESELAEAGTPAEALAAAEAEAASLAGERETLAAELAEAESELHAAHAKEESERELAGELETRLPPELRSADALKAERGAIERELAGSASALDEARATLDGRSAALAGAEDACAEARDRHLEASAVVERAHEDLASVVREAGFADIADYHDAKREASRLKQARARHEELRSELDAARAAYRELDDLTQVPVLRDDERGDFGAEEWERRQRERKERLQSQRVHRDREWLEGLLEQLEQEREQARRDERRLASARASVDEAAAAVFGFGAALAGLREKHELLTRLTDLAAGRLGPPEGFGGFVSATVAAEAAARAGQWCRTLTGGELSLAVAPGARQPELELREVGGQGRRAAGELAGAERWLAGFCLALACADAALVQAGRAAPETVLVDGLPEGLDEAGQRRLESWLARLEESGRSLRVGLPDDEAVGSAAPQPRGSRTAAGRAG